MVEGVAADMRTAVDHERLLAGFGKRARHRRAGKTSPDDDRIEPPDRLNTASAGASVTAGDRPMNDVAHASERLFPRGLRQHPLDLVSPPVAGAAKRTVA